MVVVPEGGGHGAERHEPELLVYELGLNVTLAVDAMTDRNSEAHTNSVTRIFPRPGETGTAQEIIQLLDERSV